MACTQIRLLALGDDPATPVVDDRLLAFPSELATVGAGSNPAFDQPTLRVGMTSLTPAVLGLRLRPAHR